MGKFAGILFAMVGSVALLGAFFFYNLNGQSYVPEDRAAASESVPAPAKTYPPGWTAPIIIDPGPLAPEMIIEDADLAAWPVSDLEMVPNGHPARTALDQIGGPHIKLGSAPEVCETDTAIACAYPSGVILMKTEYLELDDNVLYSVLLHEFAHQIQFAHWNQMNASGGFYSLFDEDVEWMADCMAQSQGSYVTFSDHKKQCSEEQVDYGARAWTGDFPS